MGVRPATPSITNSSVVNVPVLSKQQTSILPAKGIRKGSVQNIPNFCKASNELFTAKDNSIGNSGGITLVKISTHSKNNL